MATKLGGVTLGLISALLCGRALAFEFVPSEAEFNGWPEHCKARYVTTTAGEGSPFWDRVPKNVVNKWIDAFGWDSFNASHHYCAGLIWLNRAKVETDPTIRAFDLRWAKEETLFTYQRLATDSALYIQAGLAAALVELELGRADSAIELMRKAVDVRPTDPAAYIGLANIYLATHNPSDARDALLQADKLLSGKSAEVHYNLGLIMLDLGDADNAVQHAHAAYSLGYPLPGLRRKLTALGRWSQ